MISKQQIDLVWQNAAKAEGKDENEWRLDPCGALISKKEYGNRQSEFGWEVDHVVSKSYLLEAGASESEIDIDENLRAMHWANNESKGTNYPEYVAVRVWKDGKNVVENEYFTINKDRQNSLKLKFSKYGI